MKKIISIFAAALVVVFSAAAQNVSDDQEQKSQVLIPKDVYIGDSAQIQYTFRSAVDLFAFAYPEYIENNLLHLDTSVEFFSGLQDKVTVKDAVLDRNGLQYTLIITIIPWKPGTISFESFNLIDAIPGAYEKNEYHINYQVKLNSISIASLSDKMGTSQLRPPVSPVYLPGTNYVVWALIILSLVIIFLVIFLIVKFPAVINSFSNMKKSFGNFQNSFTTRRHLKKLLREKKTDTEFASSWQSNMKNYLDYRFETSFASVPGSKVAQKIKEITGGTASDDQDEAIEKLSSMFIRADYIRYAHGAVGTSELQDNADSTRFGKTERQDIVEDSFSCMKVFDQKESSEESSKENNDEERSVKQ